MVKKSSVHVPFHYWLSPLLLLYQHFDSHCSRRSTVLVWYWPSTSTITVIPLLQDLHSCRTSTLAAPAFSQDLHCTSPISTFPGPLLMLVLQCCLASNVKLPALSHCLQYCRTYIVTGSALFTNSTVTVLKELLVITFEA